MRYKLVYFIIALLFKSTITLAGGDSATLNHQKWEELSKKLDYTEEKPAETKADPVRFDPNKMRLPVNSGFLKAILYTLVIVLIVYLLYRLNFAGLIRSWLTKKSSVSEIPEEPEKELTPSSELLKQALSEKDHKLSLKLLYLACLHYLAEKELLRIKNETTNAAYIRQLRDYKTQQDFRKIVRYHELTWFGEKEIDNDHYALTVEIAKRIMEVKGL